MDKAEVKPKEPTIAELDVNTRRAVLDAVLRSAEKSTMTPVALAKELTKATEHILNWTPIRPARQTAASTAPSGQPE